ncbi:MAG: hypothetical protein E7425_13715 [Ruminococcaceae bacterium]|jgi:hypothetical protein|nr:hypothetical protein [Oscillospiraceae bacterium]
MESLLIRERYKVVRAIAIQPGYALLEAVDISERETPSCLLNLYEGELLHRYARICAGIRKEDCPAFREMFLERGTLVAVFDRSGGESIDQFFYRGDSWSWQDRLLFAELVLHRALSIANLPPEVSCSVLLSENVLFDLTNERVNLRWMLRPMDEMNAREVALLAADQVRKILPRTLRAGTEELRFLDQLDAGTFRSVVALYGCWRDAEQAIREEREEFERKNFIRRGMILIGRAFRRMAERGGGLR